MLNKLFIFFLSVIPFFYIFGWLNISCEYTKEFLLVSQDGYAVMSADGAGLRAVIGGVVAGDGVSHAPSLVSGSCYRINTGAPVPAGADAVVQVR